MSVWLYVCNLSSPASILALLSCMLHVCVPDHSLLLLSKPAGCVRGHGAVCMVYADMQGRWVCQGTCAALQLCH
jgi:hypothetical protein